MTHTKSGLTILEMMIALGILALVLLGFLSAFTTARRSAAMAHNHMSGLHMARQQMETLLSYKWQDPALNVGTHALSNGLYVVSLNPSNALMKNVDLTVRWCEPNSTMTSSVTLTTAMIASLHE